MKGKAGRTDQEEHVFQMAIKCARENRPMLTNLQIAVKLGRQSVSTASTLILRLEKRGDIEVMRFVNERQIRIPSLGIETLGPSAPRTHHFSQKVRAEAKPLNGPAPSIAMIASDDPGLASAIRAECANRRIDIQDFLIQLVRDGWDYRQLSKDT